MPPKSTSEVESDLELQRSGVVIKQCFLFDGKLEGLIKQGVNIMKELKSLVYFAGVLTACGVMVGCRSSKAPQTTSGNGKLTILSGRGVVPAPYPAPQLVHNNGGAGVRAVSTRGNAFDDEAAAGGAGDFPEFVTADSNAQPVAPTTQFDIAKPEDASPRPVPVAPPKSNGPRRTYTVVKGDTLSGIGYMYQVSMYDLAAENNMGVNDKLYVGRVLNLPESAAATPRPRQVKKATSKPAPKASATSATSATAVKKSDAPKQAAKPLPANGEYTVVAGDSLWVICHKFGLKGDDVRALNPNVNFNNLQIGQKIKLAGGVNAAKSSATAKAPAAKSDVPKPPAPPSVKPPAVPETAPAPQVPTLPAPQPPAPQPPAPPAPTAAPAIPAAPAVPANGGITVPTLPAVNELAPEPSPITPAPANNAEQPPLP